MKPIAIAIRPDDPVAFDAPIRAAVGIGASTPDLQVTVNPDGTIRSGTALTAKGSKWLANHWDLPRFSIMQVLFLTDEETSGLKTEWICL